ncbi:MAG: 16S rRNA (guanine(966)-N(2))-methyltransferase RsmD [Bacteroidetes bacterium]|nr:16S rRNA (guanine(966)-N(2))-methyltransferase RsmD [Bacteroidota bacterium]
MRIISGKWRGKIITAPANLPVRPTTDFAKTGLFNILNNLLSLEDATVIDLFSGTGNITFECLSRGAAKIACVDASKLCTRFITETLKKLDATNVQVIHDDVLSFLNTCSFQADLIFGDPPYEFAYKQQIVETIFAKQLLNSDGLFVLEHGKEDNFKDHPHFMQERKYGIVHFTFFSQASGNSSTIKI